MTDPAAGLAEKYDAVPYAAQANPLCHPDHLASVATLLGLAPPDVTRCRVLELGCSNGANLLPMAAALPSATFVGCDLSARAIAAARSAASAVGLTNVTLLQQDLRELDVDAPAFDYIIAHGVYSWVPAAVRDALLDLAARRLASNGVMFISYNTYPGCHVRRAAWDILHFHVDGIADPAARLSAARELAGLLALQGNTQDESGALLREEFRRLATQSDSALFHDDLGVPNDPVYFHEFAAHVARHGLAFLAEAKLSMMTAVGIAPPVQQLLAGKDRLAREQYLDFARFRRFRQSLLCHRSAVGEGVLLPDRVAAMHIGASTTLQRVAAEGRAFATGTAAAGEAGALRALLEWLIATAPRTVRVEDVVAWLHQRAGGQEAARPELSAVRAMLLDACVSGVVSLNVRPPTAVPVAGNHPTASAMARWQAQQQEPITNLRHETLTLKDAAARQCLALLDGRRDRGALVAALRPTFAGIDDGQIERQVDEYLAQFVRLALLTA